MHQSQNTTNKTLVRVWVWVRAWITICIRHTENTELLPLIATVFYKKNTEGPEDEAGFLQRRLRLCELKFINLCFGN